MVISTSAVPRRTSDFLREYYEFWPKSLQAKLGIESQRSSFAYEEDCQETRHRKYRLYHRLIELKYLYAELSISNVQVRGWKEDVLVWIFIKLSPSIARWIVTFK